MAEDAPRSGPVALRIKLRCDTIDAFIDRYAPLLGRSGMFLQSRSPKPVGSELRFDLRLADDSPALVGLGTVREVRPFDPDAPRAPHGMLVTFTRVTRDSREVLLRAIAYRRDHGLEDDAAGMPVLDAIPRAALSTEPSAPVQASGPVTVTAADAEMTGSLPLATPLPDLARPESAPAAELSQRVTAPIAALSPEPGRRHRPRPSELVAGVTVAAGASAAVELDAELDLAAVMGRARALAGDDLDGALAELDQAVTGRHQRAAVPEPALGIDEVSARLAALTGVVVARAPARSATPMTTAEEAPPSPAAAMAAPATLAEGTGDRLAAAIEDGGEHTDIRTMPEVAALGGQGERAPEPAPEHTIIGVAPAGPHARANPAVDEPTSEPAAVVEQAVVEAAEPAAVEAPAADLEPSGDAIAIDEDFEILAEADEADADLMAASGEADAAEVGPTMADPAGWPADADADAAAALDAGAAALDAGAPALDAGAAALDMADEAALDAAEAEAARAVAGQARAAPVDDGADAAGEDAAAAPVDPLAGSLFIVDVDTPPAGTRLPSADDFAARLDLGDDGEEETQFASRPRRASSASDLYIAAGDLAGGAGDIDVLEDDLPPASGDIYDRLPAVAGAELDDEFEEGPRAPIHRLPPEFAARIAAEAAPRDQAGDDLDAALAGLDERTGAGRAAPRAVTDDGVSIDIDLDDVDDR